MEWKERMKLYNQLTTLKEIAEEYPGKTIENIIAQLDARKEEMANERA